MQARPLDPHDDAQLRAFYDVSWRAEMDDGRPWNGHWTHDELASMLRDTTPEHRAAGLAAYDGDRLVGAGISMWSETDNVDEAYVFPMVDPPARGRGVGGALLEAMVEQSRAAGRLTLTSSAAYAGPEDDQSPPVRFAASTASTSPTPRSSVSSGCRWTTPCWTGWTPRASPTATATPSRRSSTTSPTNCCRPTARWSTN